ncbi:hypothetical protein ACOMHN_025685 [Nucella lapillus]
MFMCASDQPRTGTSRLRGTGRGGRRFPTAVTRSAGCPPSSGAAAMKPSGLSNFYQKYTEAYGIPVLGRIAVIGAHERVTDIPEHSWLGASWNQRARGLGATDSAPVSTCGEENVLCLSNDRYRDEDIMIHEMSHVVHLLGAKYAIFGWQGCLQSLYRSAKYSGKWANTYAMSTQDEYFAQGTQSFFDCNVYSARPNGIHNSINTQVKLRAYDPGLFRLVHDVYPCNNTYIKRCTYSREVPY